MALPLDVGPILRVIESAVQSHDIERLASLAGILKALLDSVGTHLSLTVCGSVTPPRETGRLLTVKEASKQTGFPESYLYRNAARIPATRRPSPGRLKFLESELIAWAVAMGRLP